MFQKLYKFTMYSSPCIPLNTQNTMLIYPRFTALMIGILSYLALLFIVIPLQFWVFADLILFQYPFRNLFFTMLS